MKKDRYVIAAILFGSLAYDSVWEKSDIDIVLVGRDEKASERGYCLIENGINIHASLVSRSKFKQHLEGQLQGSFMHSWFVRSSLLYCTDETLREYYEEANRAGSHDIQMQVLRQCESLLITLAKAQKWFHVKQDYHYSFLWILYTVESMAKIETLRKGETAGREVIHQALKNNPPLFKALYTDLIDSPKNEKTIAAALQMIEGYLAANLYAFFSPVLDYLQDEGGVRSTTDLDAYFKRLAQVNSLSSLYEWLADRGALRKVPVPRRLTEKSAIEMDEAGYYYDGEPTDEAEHYH